MHGYHAHSAADPLQEIGLLLRIEHALGRLVTMIHQDDRRPLGGRPVEKGGVADHLDADRGPFGEPLGQDSGEGVEVVGEAPHPKHHRDRFLRLGGEGELVRRHGEGNFEKAQPQSAPRFPHFSIGAFLYWFAFAPPRRRRLLPRGNWGGTWGRGFHTVEFSLGKNDLPVKRRD